MVSPRLSKDPVGFGTLDGDWVTGIPFDDERITRNGMKTNQTWARILVEENLTEAPQVLSESFNWQIVWSLSLNEAKRNSFFGKKAKQNARCTQTRTSFIWLRISNYRADFSFTWRADSTNFIWHRVDSSVRNEIINQGWHSYLPHVAISSPIWGKKEKEVRNHVCNPALTY